METKIYTLEFTVNSELSNELYKPNPEYKGKKILVIYRELNSKNKVVVTYSYL
jgi:hypothetical protein